MNNHEHARLTPKGRALLVSRVLDEGWMAAAAADAVGVSCRTGYKGLARFRLEGLAGLADRSSRPKRIARTLPADAPAWAKRREILQRAGFDTELIAGEGGAQLVVSW